MTVYNNIGAPKGLETTALSQEARALLATPLEASSPTWRSGRRRTSSKSFLDS